jgi:Bacterial PH domain
MNEVFEIAASNARWGFVALGLIPVLIGLGLVASGLNTPKLEITDAGLRLSGEFYGRFIPSAELELEQSRLVDLKREPNLEPILRTFGTGLPGYNTGWFRLRNGEKALLYLTDRSQAVYVPTTAGYSVLVSPKDPVRFLEHLRRLK